MTKVDLRKAWWLIILCYVAFIYSTLGCTPAIWDKIDAFFGYDGVSVLYILYWLIFILLLFYIIFIKRERSEAQYVKLFIFILIFLTMVRLEKYPGEKIHMAEYGLLGVFLYNALKIDFGIFDRRLYIFGSLISIIIGAVDEVVQLALPNRFFTWHDVFVNGLSGILTLLIIRVNILKR
jgi:hypothetical protein